jgi:hypothetical protein
MNFNLFTFNNPKTQKTKDNYLSIVLHLSPAKMSGKNFCPFSKIAGCEDSCLNTAGRGGIFKKSLNGEYEETNAIQKARYRRSRLFIEQPDIFKKLLLADIKVIDCDEHDLRFLDKKNTVIGLRAKGKAKKETNGFVIYA